MSVGETPITLVGNLTDDPELRFTPAGVAAARFTVASTPRTFDKTTNQWKDGTALFLRCTAWRDLAEHAAETLTKGMRVIVTGRLVQHNTAPDGRLFRAVRDGPIRSQEYGAVWQEARRKALTPHQVASPLARIPYDLRHACISFWLRSGVSGAEAARRAGQSIAVLQRYYAKVLDGEEARMNTLIEKGFREQEA